MKTPRTGPQGAMLTYVDKLISKCCQKEPYDVTGLSPPDTTAAQVAFCCRNSPLFTLTNSIQPAIRCLVLWS